MNEPAAILCRTCGAVWRPDDCACICKAGDPNFEDWISLVPADVVAVPRAEAAEDGQIALYLLSRITKTYRSFDGDNELTRSAIAAAERLLADIAARAVSETGATEA